MLIILRLKIKIYIYDKNNATNTFKLYCIIITITSLLLILNNNVKELVHNSLLKLFSIFK